MKARLAAAILLVILLAGCVFYFNPLWVYDQFLHVRLWRAGVHSRSVVVDGNRIHYFEAGPASGPLLVLIHGLGSRAEDWAPLIPTLAASGFHVYAPDLLGYGRSAHPTASYSIPLEESTVVDFMHALNIPRADLDGWSMGGWIAAAIALDHPTLVNRLVLDDSAGITFDPIFPRTAFVPTNAAQLAYLESILSPHPLAYPPFVVRAILRRLARNGPIVQQSLDSMETGRNLLDTRLASITQPTLIVWGAEDKLIPPSVGLTMQRDIPGAQFVPIPGCGHLAPLECPAPVLAATTRFLASSSGLGSPRL